jgi:hypothetical protein
VFPLVWTRSFVNGIFFWLVRDRLMETLVGYLVYTYTRVCRFTGMYVCTDTALHSSTTDRRQKKKQKEKMRQYQ